MKISLQWLKEFVDFDLSPEELSKLLRGLGFDTAGIERFGGELSNIVTAKVESREKHPQADKLSLCRVFDGTTRWSIVCGAPNVAAGQIVPLARLDAKLPGGTVIKKAVIRGQESQGMLCSTRELGLGDDHAGIMVLPEGTPIGEDIRKTLSLDDTVLDIEIMPNRPDMLSHWGVAREISAALKKKLRTPDIKIPKAKKVSGLVSIQEKTLCSRYIGRTVEGVQVKPSPLWMKFRLERCGIRSINNVVDVTNYVLLEWGHPLHAFDGDKLRGGKVVVRLAKPGESLNCLDDVTRDLPADALVIADAERPVAIAGVMGGQESAVSDGTKNLLVESAVFQSSSVRRTRRKLNMSTESSYRFERGTDANVAEWAAGRAVHLFLTLAGGKLTCEQDVQTSKPAAVHVKASGERINQILGTDFSPAQIKGALERLGFSCAGSDAALSVSPPVHRQDIWEDADLAEEVARLNGYDHVPTRRRIAGEPPEPMSPERRLVQSARNFLMGCGFYEAKNYGLVSREFWETLNVTSSGEPVELDNPLSLSGELLSPSLLANLLSDLQTNARYGNKNVRLFETAHVFRRNADQPAESLNLAFVAQGEAAPSHWKFKARPLEVWEMKAWVKSLIREWRLAGVRFDRNGVPAYFHPVESQCVFVGDKVMGYFGRIHPRRADALDLPRDTFLAELDLTALTKERFLEQKFSGVPRYPAVYRDLSLVFAETVSWSSIALHLARRFEWVESVELFDVFKDDSLPAGHRSLAFSLTLRHPDRTLSEVEAADLQARIVADLQTSFQAVPRTVAPKSS